MTRTRVLVTGIGGGGHGHEIVKALRLADRYWIMGVDMVATSFGIGDVDESDSVVPASDPGYIDQLLGLCRQHDIQVVVHGSEPELRAISAHREVFLEAGVLPLVNTPDIIALGSDKRETMRRLDQAGFAHPETVCIDDTTSVPEGFPLPAIVKPAVGGGGSSNTYIVQDAEELGFVCRYLVRQGITVLLQEYVGTPQDEYTVGVLHSLDGDLYGSIALRRQITSGLSSRHKAPNRTGRDDLSPTLIVSSGISQGSIGDYPEVREACEGIAEALGSRGPLNIQCRAFNGSVYPFEINPRFSGTTYMRAMCGFNEPDILIRRHLHGETFDYPIPYRTGTIVRGLSERLIDASAAASA